MAPPRLLVAYVVGQTGVHAAMAGLRLAASLQALRDGHAAWSVGLLLALFAAAPVALALHAGRLADRHGYHRPVRIAVAMSLLGVLAALGSALVRDRDVAFVLLCLAAMLTGAGANMGMLTIQRTAGVSARDSTERVRIFSWLAIAPSFSNVVGPVAVGFAIDAAGFAAAYALLLVLPLATLAAARAVPPSPPPAGDGRSARTAWDLLSARGLRRLLVVNWLLSMCWDVHTFAVPVLGHERGYSASTIGLVLGTFTASVTAVRALIPLLAHRLSEVQVVTSAMVGTAVVFALYPLAPTPWAMAACALLLGLTLGSVQPMVLSTLHRVTPEHRHGEALAFRSMAMNASSTAMPLVFGAVGAAVGAALIFWVVGAAVGSGAWLARRLDDA